MVRDRRLRVGRFAAISVLSVALAILAIFLNAARAMAQTAAGSVTSVTGSAQIQRGTGGAIAATPGTPVDVGDHITTSPGGHIAITLSDGSSLELGENSNLTIDAQTLGAGGGRAETRLGLLSGVVRSVVSATGGAPNFQVHTPNAVAAVRGTRFDTAFTQGTGRPAYSGCDTFTDVAVYDGNVSVANLKSPGNGVNVPAGYEVTVPCDVQTTSPGPLGMTGAVSGVGPGGSQSGSTSAGSASYSAAGAGVPPPSCPVCVMPASH
jgi:ferric-dicitrate binding protein FerR (iron transport regulator)